MTFDWLSERDILAIHDAQLAEHGGGKGLRQHSLLLFALERPRNIAIYSQDADVPSLAAMYAIGIARNHPFVDGNKRTAFVTLETFLALNGWGLIAEDEACVAAMLGLASGELDEAAFTQWVQSKARPQTI